MGNQSQTSDGQTPCVTLRVDCEDVASVIMFIDTFLPYLDMTDEASLDTAVNVFRVREKLHLSLGDDLGAEIPKGVLPL